MRKPWSISTTVRNPERLRGFLSVLAQLEGRLFDAQTQVEYQILLIQARLYRPNNLPDRYIEYYNDPSRPMPYEVAQDILNSRGMRILR